MAEDTQTPGNPGADDDSKSLPWLYQQKLSDAIDEAGESGDYHWNARFKAALVRRGLYMCRSKDVPDFSSSLSRYPSGKPFMAPKPLLPGSDTWHPDSRIIWLEDAAESKDLQQNTHTKTVDADMNTDHDIKAPSPYHRWVYGWTLDVDGNLVEAPPVLVDVYSILDAYPTQNTALDHLIKKALVPGGRGHKDRVRDMRDIKWSAERAIEIEKARNQGGNQ